ncbi:hypothetical protein A3863_14500 (plasmid) [Priestia endophytica]|uniref:Uncharacterized protein n=1 Tax=Priestia endophytica TaxID=135735 RepID=A0AAX1QAF4_9BACI|nr:hypothetical protein A3864_07680 [Priestia endophytica]RAS88176.1 hypothetical protein A3863_14500 [Priestia endophytica]
MPNLKRGYCKQTINRSSDQHRYSKKDDAYTRNGGFPSFISDGYLTDTLGILKIKLFNIFNFFKAYPLSITKMYVNIKDVRKLGGCKF